MGRLLGRQNGKDLNSPPCGGGGKRLSTRVVLVIDRHERLKLLREKLAAQQPPLAVLTAIGEGEIPINEVAQLNPAAARRQRQKNLVRWLLPFGFMAGLTFTYMTDLDTFAFFGEWSQHLIGALLGLGSGWMGSYAAAASVRSEADDRIRSLRNRLEEGNWLLLLETANGVEMPWTTLQQGRPKAVVRLADG